MPPPPRDCACHSGLRYVVCCAPYHSGEREAPTPEALMRSRYAAYAMGLGEYLVKTLAAGHPELASPRAEHVRALSQARQTQRFLDLCILHASADGEAGGAEGEVLFYARIFERGADRSFAELSLFRREGEAWRYAAGVAVPAERLPKDVRALDRAAFVALASAHGEKAGRPPDRGLAPRA